MIHPMEMLKRKLGRTGEGILRTSGYEWEQWWRST